VSKPEQVSVLPEVDAVMAAIVCGGLRPTLAAARAGKKYCMANKETLVMAAMCSWRRCG